ncbi:hypothetical protein OIO90_003475 [Microbotryomycetes sp. JL221]|nr:hypothetical protein OIO90_003475 [Microbotryomycetes sp. JL221]
MLTEHILRNIFAELESKYRDKHTLQGGKIARWTSNEHFYNYTLVCRAWTEPAYDKLYSSVGLFSDFQATCFLRTIQDKPQLADAVNKLAVGLGLESERSNDIASVSATSHTIVDIINRCRGLHFLHVRALHSCVRQSLLSSLRNRKLDALVLGPCLPLPEPNWSTELHYPSDVCFAACVTETLELQYDLPSPLELEQQRQIEQRLSENLPDKLSIRNMRISADLSDIALFALLERCSQLQYLDVYIERALPASSPTNEQLDLIDPNRESAFDFVIQESVNLEHLTVTSTEISDRALRRLPPKLTTLTVQAYNHKSCFRYTTQLKDLLQDPKTDLKNLETIEVKDLASAWNEIQIEEIKLACASRGIRFFFTPDSITSSSAGSSMSTGSMYRTGGFVDRADSTASGDSGSGKSINTLSNGSDNASDRPLAGAHDHDRRRE